MVNSLVEGVKPGVVLVVVSPIIGVAGHSVGIVTEKGGGATDCESVGIDPNISN